VPPSLIGERMTLIGLRTSPCLRSVVPVAALPVLVGSSFMTPGDEFHHDRIVQFHDPLS
jgi:hypothetical protein